MVSSDEELAADVLECVFSNVPIALDGFMKGDVLVYFLTRRGRELLDSGEHGSVLAG